MDRTACLSIETNASARAVGWSLEAGKESQEEKMMREPGLLQGSQEPVNKQGKVSAIDSCHVTRDPGSPPRQERAPSPPPEPAGHPTSAVGRPQLPDPTRNLPGAAPSPACFLLGAPRLSTSWQMRLD